jgi:L-rhamnose mutarotase
MGRRRVVRALDVIDDARIIADYRSWHTPGTVWPEVIAYIRATGVLDMEILNVGNRLFMLLEVAEDFPRRVAEPAQVADWERLMSELQRPLPGASPGEKWIELTRIFALNGTSEIL